VEKGINSLKLLSKIAGRRIKDAALRLWGCVRWKGIKEHYSQYTMLSHGDSYCSFGGEEGWDQNCPPGHIADCCGGNCKHHVNFDPYTPTLKGFLKESFIGTYTETLKIVGCLIHGHDIVETGGAGPDSGWIGADCRRCDMSWSQSLY
jgi:hypothetical protein